MFGSDSEFSKVNVNVTEKLPCELKYIHDTVCLDFDGCISEYKHGWTGDNEIPDLPVPGAFEAILSYIRDGLDVVVMSSRALWPTGAAAIRWWLRHHLACLQGKHPLERNILSHWVDNCVITGTKPGALMYIDDRGYRFEGNNWPTPEQVREQPWNRK